MKKVPLNCFITLDKLVINEKVTEEILRQIDILAAESYDNGPYDNVSKLDWSRARDFDRPWVQIFKPILQNYFNWLCNELGYNEAIIEEIWFQQYVQGNTHGWHTHGSNFSGVYYLEFPEGAPNTMLVHPYNQIERIEPQVTKNDIIVFPAFTLHKAPLISNNLRKTIISFNVVFSNANQTILKNLKL